MFLYNEMEAIVTVMHITLESDYAIRIVLYLVRVGKRVEAKKIAENTEVTLRFALKILRKLVAADIIKSFKGTQGGYEINKKPEDITLADVIETVEGTYYLSRCLNPEIGCNKETQDPYCKIRREFARISKYVQQELHNITIDKLL